MATDTQTVANEFRNEIISKYGPDQQIYFRFNVERGLEELGLEHCQPRHQAQIRTATNLYLEEIADQIEICARRICCPTGEQDYGELEGMLRDADPTKPIEYVSTLPTYLGHDPDFQGRDEILDQMRQTLETQPRVALQGLGGVGKTKIAVEYALKYHALSDLLWVYAGSVANFEESYVAIAKGLEFEGWDDSTTNVREIVQKHLAKKSARQRLMIVDNADDFSMFFPSSIDGSLAPNDQSNLANSLPPPDVMGGRIIITTRDKRLGLQLTSSLPIPVQSLPPTEAKVLLSAKILDQNKWDDKEAERLITKLDCHPLAITQAAAFINQFDDITLIDYLKTLEQDIHTMTETLSEDLYDARRAPGTPNAIFKTWQVSYSLLRRGHPEAADLLCLMATLDCSSILARILRMQDDITLRDRRKVQTLLDFSLIRGSLADGVFSMHRLVQLSTRTWMASIATIAHWQAEAISNLCRVFPSGYMVQNDRGVREFAAELLPQANYLSAYTRGHGMNTVKLLHDLACCEDDLGKTAAALGHVMLCLDIERTECLWSLETAHRENFGASLWMKLGDVEQAKKLNLAAFMRFEKSENHNSAWIASVEAYAAILCEQNLYPKAASVFYLALDASIRIHGERQIQTLACARNIATCFTKVNLLCEAEQVHRELVEHSVAINGRENCHTLEFESSLSMTLMAQKKYTEAEKIARTVFSVSQRVIGQDHPPTLCFQGRLADILCRQGRVEESVRSSRELLEVSERVLGYDHRDTMKYRCGLADSVRCIPEGVPEATALYGEVGMYYGYTLGRTHPTALHILQKFATGLYKQHKVECLDAQIDLADRFLERDGETQGFLRCRDDYKIWREDLRKRGVDLGKHSLPTEADKKALEECQSKISEISEDT